MDSLLIDLCVFYINLIFGWRIMTLSRLLLAVLVFPYLISLKIVRNILQFQILLTSHGHVEHFLLTYAVVVLGERYSITVASVEPWWSLGYETYLVSRLCRGSRTTNWQLRRSFYSE